MLPAWFYLGRVTPVPWTWYLAVPAFVWVAGFILVDRLRHKRRPREPGDPLLESVTESLTQIEHQISLLRNVFWWYLLPFTIPLVVFFAHVSLRASKNWLEALTAGGSLILFSLFVYAFIDYINQRAVRTQLEPRRQELLALLKSLQDDSTSESALQDTQSVGRSGIARRWLIVAVLSFLAFVVMALASVMNESSYDGPARSSGPAGDWLAELVSRQRKEKHLVGLAAMVTVDGQTQAAAAEGERRKGSGVPLEISDRWHLGGITKSITATMIARLVEAGHMQWTDTIGEAFPDTSVHEDWKPVTLRQLLTDTAGAPTNFPFAVLRQRPALGPECTQARREAVANVIADEPAYPPGEKYAYSNVGFTIAAAMAEKVTGADWEDLVKREVFEPLKLTHAGFGPPNSADETLEQPRGHRSTLAGKIAVDDRTDNTPIMDPSGMVHMSLRDLCTYAEEHLRGQRGEGTILSDKTYQTLHDPQFDAYACGWIRKKPGKEMPYTSFWHNGTNTMWYALVVIVPEQDMVVAVTSNDGDFAQAEAAAWEIVKASAKHFHAPANPSTRETLPNAGQR